MVQEMITAVKDAEDKAENILAEAEIQRKQLIDEAKKKAEAEKVATIQNLKDEKDRLLAEKKKQLDEAGKEADKLIEDEVKNLRESVKDKKEQGIEAVMKNFY